MVTLSPTCRLRSPEACPICFQTCPLSRCRTIALGQRSRPATWAVTRSEGLLLKIFQGDARCGAEVSGLAGGGGGVELAACDAGAGADCAARSGCGGIDPVDAVAACTVGPTGVLGAAGAAAVVAVDVVGVLGVAGAAGRAAGVERRAISLS